MKLQNRIDFAVVIVAECCNPNGDPLNGNRPRHDYDGYGEITDVCIKRKIRNRLQDMGERIFVQASERSDDGCRSLQERANSFEPLKKEIKNGVKANRDLCIKLACEEWIDVRSFGQIFAFKGAEASFGVRGPVSLRYARSLEPIDPISTQITKSVNSADTGSWEKDSATMGIRHRIDRAVYVTYGSILPQLAGITGFSEEDAEKIKYAMQTMFEGDASSARPSGSMEVAKLFWWKHNCKWGQCSPAKVHHSLHFTPTKTYPYFEVEVDPIPDLEPEIIDM